MSTYINGQNVIFTNLSDDPVITLKASAGKTLSIEASSTSTNILATNITTGTLNVTSGSITNLTVTNETATNLNVTNATVTSLNVSNSKSTNSTITTLNVTNEIATAITTTNLSSTNSIIVNGTFTQLNVSNALFQNFTTTNLNATNSNVSASTITGLSASTAVINNATISNLNLTNLNLTASTVSNIYVSSISSGRVVYATASGLLTSDSHFLYDPVQSTITVPTANISVLITPAISQSMTAYNRGNASFFRTNTDTTGSLSTYNPSCDSIGKEGYSVSIYGDTIAVGNPQDHYDSTYGAGSVSVFRYTSGSWSVEQLIKPSYSTCFSHDHGLVSIYKNSLIFCGTRIDQDNGSGAIWTRSGTTWTEQFLINDPIRYFLDIGTDIACGVSSGYACIVYTRSGTTWTKVSTSSIFPSVMTNCCCNDTLVIYNNTSITNGQLKVINSAGTVQATITGTSTVPVGTYTVMSSDLIVTVSGSVLSIYKISDYTQIFYKKVSGVTLTMCSINSKASDHTIIMYGNSTNQYFLQVSGTTIFGPQDNTSFLSTLAYTGINSFACYKQTSGTLSGITTVVLGNPTFSTNRGLIYITSVAEASGSQIENSRITIADTGITFNNSIPMNIISDIPTVSSSMSALCINPGGLYANTALVTSGTVTTLNSTTVNAGNISASGNTISTISGDITLSPNGASSIFTKGVLPLSGPGLNYDIGYSGGYYRNGYINTLYSTSHVNNGILLTRNANYLNSTVSIPLTSSTTGYLTTITYTDTGNSLSGTSATSLSSLFDGTTGTSCALAPRSSYLLAVNGVGFGQLGNNVYMIQTGNANLGMNVTNLGTNGTFGGLTITATSNGGNFSTGTSTSLAVKFQASTNAANQTYTFNVAFTSLGFI